MGVFLGLMLAALGEEAQMKVWSQEGAGWVQAIGSVAGILIGAAAIRWQVRQQHRQTIGMLLKRDLDVLREACDFVAKGRQLLLEAERAAATHAGYNLYLSEMHADKRWLLTVELMRKVDVTTIPGAELKVAYVAATDCLDEALDVRVHALAYAGRGQLAEKHAEADKFRYGRSTHELVKHKLVLEERLKSLMAEVNR